VNPPLQRQPPRGEDTTLTPQPIQGFRKREYLLVFVETLCGLELEEQMLGFLPDMPKSPDRVDAVCWAAHQLIVRDVELTPSPLARR